MNARPAARSAAPLVALLAMVAVALPIVLSPAGDRAPTARLLPQTPPPAEVPAANPPESLRVRNYAGGSCVHASTATALAWCGRQDLADHWRRTYSGGEYFYRLRQRLEREGIPYTFTDRGDAAVLEYATRTRRAAVIGYFTAHAVNFCGFHERDGKAFAVLLDNNRPGAYLWIDRAEFLDRWRRQYGGDATVILFAPAPAISWSPFLPAPQTLEAFR